ncbi:hypothetical protein MC885_016477 [Smutsia gigantea]|nr:hypothetical protein MC885_016477 [Smutsia gigantea]
MLLRPLLLLCLLLAAPTLTHTCARPLWYQVGLDLQPWGCQPDSLEVCRGSLSCPSHWVGLGLKHIYPMAGATLTTIMVLAIRRVLQRRSGAAAKASRPSVTTDPAGPWKRRAPISDRTILLKALHMLDALLLHIECHLWRLDSQQKTQIKGTPAQSG